MKERTVDNADERQKEKRWRSGVGGGGWEGGVVYYSRHNRIEEEDGGGEGSLWRDSMETGET